MFETHNNLENPEAIPPGGVDKSVTCANCFSACCREGMAIPLTKKEKKRVFAHTLIERVDPSEYPDNPGWDRKYYELKEDCEHLIEGADGKTRCNIHDERDKSDTSQLPRACREFEEGSYGCVLVQLAMLHRDEIE